MYRPPRRASRAISSTGAYPLLVGFFTVPTWPVAYCLCFGLLTAEAERIELVVAIAPAGCSVFYFLTSSKYLLFSLQRYSSSSVSGSSTSGSAIVHGSVYA